MVKCSEKAPKVFFGGLLVRWFETAPVRNKRWS